jgi:hypothetical protein
MIWEQATRNFLEADVIEWTEAIWPPSTSRKKKPRPWGKQTVTGQITGIDGDFVSVLVLKALITENEYSAELRTHKVGSTIRKKRETLLKGSPERLHWSEEDVRAALLSETHNFKT